MSNKRKTVLAGGFIPPALANLLSLRSLYEGFSRSKIIGDLLNEYLMSGPTVEEMCDNIAERLFNSWLYLESSKDLPWEEYLKNEKNNLEKNGISEEHITIIVDKAKQKKKEKIKHYGTNK